MCIRDSHELCLSGLAVATGDERDVRVAPTLFELAHDRHSLFGVTRADNDFDPGRRQPCRHRRTGRPRATKYSYTHSTSLACGDGAQRTRR